MNALKIIKNDLLINPKSELDSYLEDKLVVSTQSKIYLSSISSIIYIKAESNYSRIELKEGKSILASTVLKQFDIRLKDHHFIRIHASFIINLRQLDHIKKNGEYNCIMKDGTQIRVSKSYRDTFIERILKHKV